MQENSFYSTFIWLQKTDAYQWILSSGMFLVLATVLFFSWNLLWKRLNIWASSTKTSWDNKLLVALKNPLQALILTVAFGFSFQLAPLEFRSHPAFVFSVKTALVFCGFWITERIVFVFFRTQFTPQTLSETTRVLLMNLTRVLLIVLGALIVLDTVGISITPILASLGVGSVAVALALQDTLSNFFSGIYLLVDKPIRIGDFIKLDTGIEGTITKIGWRSTHVKMLSNNVVVIPNSKVASSQVTNYNFPEEETSIVVQVGASYSGDLEKIEKITAQVAADVLKQVEGGAAHFQPLIRYYSFGDSSINFSVILRAKKYEESFLIKHAFIKALHARYQKEGIEIPFPQQVVHLKNTGQ